MADHEGAPQAEQPADSVAPSEQDSIGNESLQSGGITPQVEAALAKLPPQEADLVRQDIAQKNAHLTKSQQSLAAQRKALERDVQMAGVLKSCLKDPEFNEYLEAREKGDTKTFFLRKAGPAASQQDHSVGEDNRTAGVVPSENGSEMPAQSESELAKRLERIERETFEAQKQRIVEEFQAKHPDWEEHLTTMQAFRSYMPGASLEHLYYAARGAVEANSQSDAGTQQGSETQGLAPQQSPPLPVGNPPGSSTPASGPPPATMAEALAQAKAELGIQGPISFSYQG